MSLNEVRAPTQPHEAGPFGIRYDFVDGCRIVLPEASHPWHVRRRDNDSGNMLEEKTLASGMICSAKRYYVRFGIEVWAADTKTLLIHSWCSGVSFGI